VTLGSRQGSLFPGSVKVVRFEGDTCGWDEASESESLHTVRQRRANLGSKHGSLFCGEQGRWEELLAEALADCTPP